MTRPLDRVENPAHLRKIPQWPARRETPAVEASGYEPTPDGLSRWIAVLTTPHLPNAQSPATDLSCWIAVLTTPHVFYNAHVPCDDLSCWIAVLTTPHTWSPDAQSPVGAALVAARRGLGRGNHICVATTPPHEA